MKTKLTLRLDDAVVARAKAYAAARGTSVSGLVEDYFRLVASGGDGGPPEAPAETTAPDWRASLGPRVRALVDRPAPAREVTEDDHRRHLAEKHGAP